MIVAIVPDRFKDRMEAESFYAKERSGYRQGDVRRPTRGLQLKEDSYATMRMMLGNGKTIQLVNAGSSKGTDINGKRHSDDYSNFLIQAVNEDRAEKQQVVETFGEAFIFFFGERPRVLNIQGILINTFDFNWEAEWWYNYENYLRGTKCVEHDARVFLTYDETMVSGYILACSSAKNAQERNHVPLSFQLFVTDYVNISALGDPNADQSGEHPVLSGALSNAYRPMLIPKEGMAPSLMPVRKVSLIEKMTTDAISKIQDTWNLASEFSNNALLSMDSVLGNPVRVPQGFEGALMFDEQTVKVSELPPGVFGTNIKYTTFGDNSDEFVGASSPYSSADIALGDSMYSTFSGVNDFLSSEKMVTDAAAQWSKRGFLLPPPMLSKVITLASQTGVGMQVIGSARKVVAGGKQARSTALDAAAPAVAGATVLLGDVALADSIAQDAGVDSDKVTRGIAPSTPTDRAQIIQTTEQDAAAAKILQSAYGLTDEQAALFNAELGGIQTVQVTSNLAEATANPEATHPFIESFAAGQKALIDALKQSQEA